MTNEWLEWYKDFVARTLAGTLTLSEKAWLESGNDDEDYAR